MRAAINPARLITDSVISPSRAEEALELSLVGPEVSLAFLPRVPYTIACVSLPV
jgi:hypothetical protein